MGDALTVSAILVTWNSAPYLRRCLEGVNAQTHPPLELIVVDNASTDGSVELVASLVPDAHIIRNDTNRGFSAAVNQALAIARGEFALFINPDAYLDPQYIARVLAAFDEAGEEYGSATGKLFRGDGTEIKPTKVIDSLGIRMTRSGRHFDIAQGEVDREPQAGWREVFGASGAAAVHRMVMLRDVADVGSAGGEILDEDFFTYREDADLAWRARLRGWRALVAFDAVALHVRTVTPAKRGELSAAVNMHGVKNRFLLRLKNEGAYLALRNAPFELARDLVAIGAVLTIERTSLPGLMWVWRNRKRVLAKRRVIQARRKVSDRDLAHWFE